MTDKLLTDRVVLVTGSTTGIGEAIADACVEQGARVMIHGRREAQARAISDRYGDSAGYVTADLADAKSPEIIMQAVTDRFGRIDCLVNNAALTSRSDLESSDTEIFDLLFAVNLRAPLLLARAALPHFRRQGKGVVLNIGSVNAYCGEKNLLVYSMTKGGLMTMTRNIADAHAHEGIRVNQMNVGWTLTDNERKIKEEEGLPEGWENKLPEEYAPYGRIFAPEEIARHAVMWLSDTFGPVNGTVYDIEQFPMIGRNPHKEV